VRRKIIFSIAISLLFAALVEQLLSQTPDSGPKGPAYYRELARQRRPRVSKDDRRKRMEQAMAQAKEQSWKEALEVTDIQWKVILPLMRKVYELRQQAEINVKIKEAAWITRIKTTKKTTEGISTGPVTTKSRTFEQWSWDKSWQEKAELTKCEKACEDLLGLFERNNTTDQDKIQKINALRKAKEEAKKELAQATEELREKLNIHQQAALVLLGWFD
jgi:hypothetical protein